MTDEEAMMHAWKQVKDSLDSETWTAGESANYFGFFTYGWNAKRCWSEHKSSECQRMANEIASLKARN